MNQILSENEINFNDLEKEFFEIACKNARENMVEVLESIDKGLQINRDKKIYRHKGNRRTTIKTIMGEHASISSFRNSALILQDYTSKGYPKTYYGSKTVLFYRQNLDNKIEEE